MPLEVPLADLGTRVAALNARFTGRSGHDILEHALTDSEVGPTALVSSFGAESVVLLHMLSVIDRSAPVLFLDTQMLFPETLEYQLEVASRLRLTDVRTVTPDRTEVFMKDPNNRMFATNPDGCCHLRKVAPLARALTDFGAWVTGRKRFHGGQRTALNAFEADAGRIKVNPLAHWTRDDVAEYMANNHLPRHPLVRQGYASIGCAPCTTRVAADEDPRAGRWRGQDKQECGLHFVDGRAKRIRA